MHITEVRLPCRSVLETGAFYRSLGCPIDADADEVRLTVGSSTLTFVTEDFAGDHHLAFTVPTGSFAAAKAWLVQHARLLARDGVDEFEAAPSWNARSVYFEGPDRQVLELIERRSLPNAIDHDFTVADLVSVSEVGVAVPDVLRAVAMLRDAGIDPYGTPPGPDFAAVGDADGLLILVAPGRPWAPTQEHLAADTGVVITADVRVGVSLTDTKRLTTSR